MKNVQRAGLAFVLTACVAAVAPPAFAQGAMEGIPRQQPRPDTSRSTGAHARYSKARINMDQPNLGLALALVNAGGGAGAFDAGKLVGALTGNGPLTQTERAALTKKFGADNVTSFLKTFNFVATDALTQTAKAGAVLPSRPAADPNDPKALAAALYDAGVTPGGRFDVEYMLDSLISHIVHVAIMNDIDASPDLGPAADANYHLVLAQVMLDLKQNYDLKPPAPPPKS